VENEIREEDTDWKRFLLNRPYVPWNPHYYREFRLYWPYSSGIPCQWMSHIIDAIQLVMDDPFPKSVVAHGGVYVWKDGRTNPDTFQALLEYPKGYLVSYSTRFGNDSDAGAEGPIIYGSNGRLDLGAMKASGEGGGGDRKIKEEITLQPYESTSHMRNWMECLRTRKQPNAPIEAGYSHSVAVIMAIRALHTGRRVTYDPATQTMSEA